MTNNVSPDVPLLDHVAALVNARDHLFEVRFEYITSLHAEYDLRYQQRFDAQQKALDAALLAAEKAVQTALTAAEKAVAKAELAAEKRFEGLNELRAVVQDVLSLQMPRLEAESRLSSMEEKITSLSVRVTAMESARRGGVDMRVTIAGLTLLAITIIGFALSLTAR